MSCDCQDRGSVKVERHKKSQKEEDEKGGLNGNIYKDARCWVFDT